MSEYDDHRADIEAAGADRAEPEESCEHHCGYVSSGRDLLEHEIHEHRPCPDCGAGRDQDLDLNSLRHRLDCLRLLPDYAYPAPAGSPSRRLADGEDTPQ